MKQVHAKDDWLSFALAEYDEDAKAAQQKRATVALGVRLDARVSTFLKRAIDQAELGERLDAVDEAVEETVAEVAAQYNADPAVLYEAAVKKIAYDFGIPFQQGQEGTPQHGYTEVQCQQCHQPAMVGQPCPHCGYTNQAGAEAGGNGGGMGGLRDRIMAAVTAAGPEMPEGARYDYERVNPNSNIGDTPASSAFQGTKTDTDVEKALGDSVDHPREMQSVEDRVEDRRTLNDGTDKKLIERKVDEIDAQKPIGSEAHGVGGTFGEGNQAQAVTSKFHLLD